MAQLQTQIIQKVQDTKRKLGFKVMNAVNLEKVSRRKTKAKSTSERGRRAFSETFRKTMPQYDESGVDRDSLKQRVIALVIFKASLGIACII